MKHIPNRQYLAAPADRPQPPRWARAVGGVITAGILALAGSLIAWGLISVWQAILAV